MITRNDCLILLREIKNNGIDTTAITQELILAPEPSMNVIKFINRNRELDLTKFYEKLRKSYNTKKSNLYINIVKEVEEVNTVLTTLASLQLQILLFSKNVENKQMFLKHARSEEISKVLALYFKTYDLTNCLKLLKIIKADIKALESIK